jgi:hypothetical protein
MMAPMIPTASTPKYITLALLSSLPMMPTATKLASAALRYLV